MQWSKNVCRPALPGSMPALSPTEDTESSLWVTTACGGNIQCPCCLAYGDNVLLLGDTLCRGYEPVYCSYPLTHRSASQGHCSQLQSSQQEQSKSTMIQHMTEVIRVLAWVRCAMMLLRLLCCMR